MANTITNMNDHRSQPWELPLFHRRVQSDTDYNLAFPTTPIEEEDEEHEFLNDLIITPQASPVHNSGDTSNAAPHLRSVSADSDFYERREDETTNTKTVEGSGSGGDDGSSSGSNARVVKGKRAITAEKIAEIARIDPKRAKRILANREAAARSKEKKTRYTTEMQRKLDTLQTHATTLSAQLTLLQGNTSCLSAENKELKLRLESLEQQAKLRKALKEALMSENNRLKMEKAKQVGKNRFSDTRLLPQLPPRVAKYGGNLNPQQQCQMPNQNQNRPRNA